MIDLNKMGEIARELHFPMVERAHGSRGSRALQELIEFLHSLYKYLAPELRTKRILVFRRLDELASDFLAGGELCISLGHMPVLSQREIVIQLLPNGQFLLSQSAVIDPIQVAEEAVVYTLENRLEKFYARAEVSIVKNPVPGYVSIFAIPTFDSLKQALAEYKKTHARKSSCKILAEAWRDKNRIFFTKAPEPTMRMSLTQFLKSCLRGDVEVRPEQVVTESRPVDIKITWFMSNRLGLIEIKWLGASKGSSGKLTRHSEGRARKGAKQLADYLDGNAVQTLKHETRGYLVVFDGRRAKLKLSTKKVDRKDGFRYENQEIMFSPEYEEIRPDFEVPIRMFMEPICQP